MTKKRTDTGLEQAAASSGSDRKIAPSGQSVRVAATEAEKLKDEWSKAGIGNAFVFGKIMTTRPDLLLELLQYSMPEMNINSIHDIGKELDISLSIDSHGIRLDVSVQDDAGRTIDVEMQLKDEKDIPRRMRYYSGAIDQTILEKGVSYNSLSETVILFITRFDPFGKDFIRYSFRNLCLEDRELELGDGSTKIVLNAMGTRGDVSGELKGFLGLVAGKLPIIEGSFAERVQEQVLIARSNSEWRRQYMEWRMTLLSEREKGREEGRIEGKKEGREEGRIEGREEGRIEGKEEGVRLAQIDLIVKKMRRGLEFPAIAELLEVDEDSIRPVYNAVKASAPDYDSDQILERLRG